MLDRHRPAQQIMSLEQRLSAEARRLREQAKSLPHGAHKEQLLRKARQAETGAHISEWRSSPGLKAPH
jgi:hypothetical protein